MVVLLHASTVERAAGRVDEQGLLFEYTVKLVLLVGLFELILYRLVSRLGMHMSKVAQQYESVRVGFKVLSSLGFTLLNLTALLIFLALVILLVNKVGMRMSRGLDRILVPLVALLMLLTVGFLTIELLQVDVGSGMVRSIIYNLVSFAIVTLLAVDYLVGHTRWAQRAFMLTYVLGVSGWLYYQSMSTLYGWLGISTPPPLVYEFNRAGEALMVLASALVFWAYGRGVSFRTKNRQQRRRALWFWSVAGLVFLALLFLDYFLELYDPATALAVRKGGQGISWIFQMGMGYTFYLPFAFYVAGLLCWSYTVVKLVTAGQLAGYGIGLMFIAGYALQLSHLTLMVILGLLLVGMDRRPALAPQRDRLRQAPLADPTSPLVTEQTT
jgi:hypothetical protein